MPFLRLLALFICTLLAACGDTEGPREAADRFFTLCAHGEVKKAYDSASKVFQLERSQKYFEARVRELGLDRATATWGELTKKSGTFVVKGEFKVGNAEPFVLTVSMVEEAGAWRLLDAKSEAADGSIQDVFSVTARSADGQILSGIKTFTEPVAPSVPTDAQLTLLAQEALLKFDEAVKQGDFKNFHAFVSDRWKFRGKEEDLGSSFNRNATRISDSGNSEQRLTVAALDRAFKPFIDAKVDLTPIKGTKMILDQPATVSTDGVLLLKGRFDAFVFAGANPPKPKRMEFKLEFVLEGAKWRIFGISVTLPQ